MKTLVAMTLSTLLCCDHLSATVMASSDNSSEAPHAVTQKVGEKVIVITVTGKVFQGTVKQRSKTKLVLTPNGAGDDVTIPLTDIEEIRTVS